jgi:hypothetical protein
MSRDVPPTAPMSLGNTRYGSAARRATLRGAGRLPPYPDDVPNPLFGPAMVCGRCGMVRRRGTAELGSARSVEDLALTLRANRTSDGQVELDKPSEPPKEESGNLECHQCPYRY